MCWPGAGLTAAPGERSFWRHFGARNQNPTFHLNFIFCAPTLVPGFPWLLWGLTPGARAAWPHYRAAWREGALPKMTLSQQWKEEPISQQCRGWGWRAGGSGPQAHCVGPIKCGS